MVRGLQLTRCAVEGPARNEVCMAITTNGFHGSVAALLIAVAACGSSGGEPDESSVVAGGTGRDGGAGLFGDGHAGATAATCSTKADCGGGECNPLTRTCTCGGQDIAATRVQANLLVVLDRSCSMTDEVSAGVTKWTASVSALTSLMTTYSNDIRFGLTLFPDTQGEHCSQAPIPFPIGKLTNAQMKARLAQSLNFGDPLFPKGPCVTNIDTGMIQANDDPAFFDKSHPGFVVLVTDGIQSPDCSAGGSNQGTLGAVQKLAKAGVGTFVVGFGSGVDEALLEAAAHAGGHARVGAAHKYFDAVDQASLDAALKAIGSATLSCDLRLTSPLAAGGNDVYVFFDGAGPAVTRDPSHTNGWDYDVASQTIHFYGATCDRLRDGSVQKESVVVGCPGGVAPPPR